MLPILVVEQVWRGLAIDGLACIPTRILPDGQVVVIAQPAARAQVFAILAAPVVLYVGPAPEPLAICSGVPQLLSAGVALYAIGVSEHGVPLYACDGGDVTH